jgi:hypothetical protein
MPLKYIVYFGPPSGGLLEYFISWPRNLFVGQSFPTLRFLLFWAKYQVIKIRNNPKLTDGNVWAPQEASQK